MTSLREKKCAKLHHLPLVSLINLLFWLTVIGWERSHDLIQKPLQFSTGLSSSGGIIWLKQGYPLLFSKLFICEKTWVSYVLLKWHCKGVNCPKNRGARGVPFMDNTPGDMDNIGKECRLPLVYTLWLILNRLPQSNIYFWAINLW